MKRTSARAGLSSTTVLFLSAEDTVESADLLFDVLTLRGDEVEVAHDGPSGLAAAARFKPRAAILDIGLPEMNGYELARRLRQLPELAPLTLIAVTGYGQDADRQRARAAGFDVHLVKPAIITELLGHLKAAEPR